LVANKGALTLLIDIRNGGHFPVKISADRLGFAVFARRHKNEDFIFNPSDGPSYAAITRTSAANSTGKSEVSAGENVQRYAWRMNPNDRLPNDFTLQIGQTRRTSVAFQLPQGSYQFLAGYGQDVLSGQCVASNSVPFDQIATLEKAGQQQSPNRVPEESEQAAEETESAPAIQLDMAGVHPMIIALYIRRFGNVRKPKF
jgi:hypothetical protein